MTQFIEPQFVAEMIAALAARLRTRAENLLAEEATWEVAGTRRVIGNATVTLAEVKVIGTDAELSCDCLLAPACAHRAAVALSLPVADEDSSAYLKEQAEPELAVDAEPELAAGQAGISGEPGSATELNQAVMLTDFQRAAIVQCQQHCAELLSVGMRAIPVTLRSGLRADLHRLRVHRLVHADRALTALLLAQTTSQQVTALGQLMANLSALASGAVSQEVIGYARSTYRDVGGLRLSAVLAEPILGASGYCGAAVTFVGADGRIWTLTRISPSELGGVAQHYQAGEAWGGVTESFRVLSRRRVLVSNATASPEGRLGGGKQVRAAVLAELPEWEVTDPLRVFTGKIAGGDRFSLRVGDENLQLTEAAVRLGAGLATELFGQARGAAVQALARRSHTGWELCGLRFTDDRFQLPEELAQVWWPGLDPGERSWLGELAVPGLEAAEVDQWPSLPQSVTAVTERWLARVLSGGAAVLTPGAAGADVSWLRAAGAPFAADLLHRLEQAPQTGIRRFDGRWLADPATLAQAWLALSQY